MTGLKERNGGKGRRNKKERGPRRWPLVVLVVILIIIPIAATVQEPDVEVTGMKVVASDPWGGMEVRTIFTVEVRNPNIAGATVLNIEGKAYVNGKYAGDFLREESVHIDALGTTTLDVDFQLKDVTPVVWDSDNEIRVVGTVTIDGAIVEWPVDFDETRTVHIP